MLKRRYGELNFECDECGDVLDTDTEDFDMALRVMRSNLWKAIKVGDVWQHYCSHCADEVTL